jgi:cell division protein FtsB
MNQENFINNYVELLSSTVMEAIQKNLVLQAQKKSLEQTLEEIKKTLEREQATVAKLTQNFDEMIKQRDKNANDANEYKKNVEHIETFKNELIKCRKNNEELLSEIQSLKEEAVLKEKTKSKVKQPKIQTENIVQDSGKF